MVVVTEKRSRGVRKHLPGVMFVKEPHCRRNKGFAKPIRANRSSKPPTPWNFKPVEHSEQRVLVIVQNEVELPSSYQS